MKKENKEFARLIDDLYSSNKGKNKKCTLLTMAMDIGITERQLYNWKSGNNYPQPFQIEKLYDYLLANNETEFIGRLNIIDKSIEKKVVAGKFTKRTNDTDREIIRSAIPKKDILLLISEKADCRDRYDIVSKFYPRADDFMKRGIRAKIRLALDKASQIFGWDSLSDWDYYLFQYLTYELPDNFEVEQLGQEIIDNLEECYINRKEK